MAALLPGCHTLLPLTEKSTDRNPPPQSGQTVAGARHGARCSDSAEARESAQGSSRGEERGLASERPLHPERQPKSTEEGRRSHVEAAFATNAFIFAVGWSWVVTLRDLSSLAFLAAAAAAGGTTTAGKLVGLLAQGGCVFVLGPVLTVTVLWTHEKLRPLELIEDTLRGQGSERRRQENPLFLL